MASYLRFRPDEYELVTEACRGLSRMGGYRAFQARLAVALRERHPALARFVATLRVGQVRLLRSRLDAPAPVKDQAAGRLTWRESLEVQEVSSLFWLRGGDLASFRAFLLAHAGPLTWKLARLSADQVAALYRRARLGVRCCP